MIWVAEVPNQHQSDAGTRVMPEHFQAWQDSIGQPLKNGDLACMSIRQEVPNTIPEKEGFLHP